MKIKQISRTLNKYIPYSKNMKKLLFAFILFNSLNLFSQNGTIRGTIYEEESGQTIIGANIAIIEPLTGTFTDLDGKFSISNAPGTYDLQISYISLKTIV